MLLQHNTNLVFSELEITNRLQSTNVMADLTLLKTKRLLNSRFATFGWVWVEILSTIHQVNKPSQLGENPAALSRRP